VHFVAHPEGYNSSLPKLAVQLRSVETAAQEEPTEDFIPEMSALSLSATTTTSTVSAPAL